METVTLEAFRPVYAEIILAVGAMFLLMVGAYSHGNATRSVSIGSFFVLALAGIVILGQSDERVLAFGGSFIVDPFAKFMKILVLVGSAGTLAMSVGYIRRENMDRFEFPVLLVLATLGMLMMVSANDLIALYMGLELQSLALYVLAAFNRDSGRSAEAGLKYFVLGSLASGLLLYGASLVYGFSGTTNFDTLATVIHENQMSTGLVFGLVFVLAGLAFKISAAPFHMWTPDVYEGAPTPVTAFFASAPKIAAMALLIRVVISAFPDAADEWRQVLVFVAIASMVLGAFAGIGQRNIKRLMGYSSIGHMGFALVGLATGSVEGVQGVIFYLSVYLVMTLGVFCCILAMRQEEGTGGGMVEEIDALAGLSRSRPVMAFLLSMLMFSLAGIPPLAGFYAKFEVFTAAIEADMYGLAVVGVLASVVGCFYYLRIVKVIYFDEAETPLKMPLSREFAVILGGAGLFTLLFTVYPGALEGVAQTAALSLFP